MSPDNRTLNQLGFELRLHVSGAGLRKLATARKPP
jgi:hypothetical protein